jgi:pyruvate formate lyase activating enzyme
VCHSGAREIVGKKMTAFEVIEEIEKDTVFHDESGGGVTFSGGEPLMQSNFLEALLKLCKERRIHTAVETCGLADSEALLRISTYVDLYLYDLKLMNVEKHRLFTDMPNEVILKNLRLLSLNHNRIIVRFPIIPGVNDDDENVLQIGRFVSAMTKVREIDLLPYHGMGAEKYKRLGRKYRLTQTKTPSDVEMAKIAQRLQDFGLEVKIGG